MTNVKIVIFLCLKEGKYFCPNIHENATTPNIVKQPVKRPIIGTDINKLPIIIPKT